MKYTISTFLALLVMQNAEMYNTNQQDNTLESKNENKSRYTYIYSFFFKEQFLYLTHLPLTEINN